MSPFNTLHLTSAVNWEWPSAPFVPHYATGHPITADVRAKTRDFEKLIYQLKILREGFMKKTIFAIVCAMSINFGVQAEGIYCDDCTISVIVANSTEIAGNVAAFSTDIQQNPDNCPTTNWVVVDRADTSADTLVSYIMLAHTSSKKIQVYVKGCFNGYPKLAQIRVK